MILGGAVLLAGLFLFHEVRSTPPKVSLPPASSTPPPAARTEDRVPTSNSPASSNTSRDVGRHPSLDEASTAQNGGRAAPGEEQNADRANPGLDAIMDQANKAYDRGDFEQAKALANEALSKLPSSVRMMRIMVSASCIEGDTAVAQQWFDKLPPNDRAQMKVRCDRYGVSFRDPPQ